MNLRLRGFRIVLPVAFGIGFLGFVFPAASAQSRTSVVRLISTPNPAVQGQLVSFTAGVVFTGGPAPTGTMKVLDGSVELSEAALDSAGAATIATQDLSVGAQDRK